ncbi:MAG: NADP-dependent isocitrate dehydrogenase [Ignavibacteriae bacterium]|nr:NADP-dependent isocitrate dehydrogenase [Ignavibacteriota bacterium]
MSLKTPITVAYGDGIGPEIMNATLDIIQAAGAQLDIEVIEIGEQVYLKGNAAGIAPEAWSSLERTKVFLKAPITTPQGGGYKSLNVATRKRLGLYANIRPCLSSYPFIKTKHPVLDVVIVRENEEDLYAGIEYRQTRQTTQGLKLISKPGSEKIIRYAFEYAKNNGRKKVTCFMKDNIMKITDGLFHKLYDEIGQEYPEIEKEAWIIDVGSAKLATKPELFDVIVLENLYGDILSDVVAEMSGSIGLGGSANIGDEYAMFEAIHGSAPRRAGQNLANPTGLLLGAVLMLIHIKQHDIASKVHNAWLKTIEDGVHTYDIFREGVSKQKVGTKEFAQAIIERLGQKPSELKALDYHPRDDKKIVSQKSVTSKETKDLVGVDVFIDWTAGSAEDLGQMIDKIKSSDLKLTGITNRGTKVYPDGFAGTFCTDLWRCRFETSKPGDKLKHQSILDLLNQFYDFGFDFVKTENLYNFDGSAGFSQ